MSARRPLATRAEVAAYLGKTTQSLALWAHHGVGPRYVKVGQHARYRWTDVDAWLDSRTREPRPAAKRATST